MIEPGAARRLLAEFCDNRPTLVGTLVEDHGFKPNMLDEPRDRFASALIVAMH